MPADHTPPPRRPVREVAAEILAEPPPLAAWDAGGDQAIPPREWTRILRKAGWPVRTVDVMLPQYEHRGPRAGQRTGDAAQPVTVVPQSWLRELARRLGARWADACRGTVG